jgi:hypothetical protein
MAEIVTTVDRDRDLTLRTVQGEVTAQELLAALASYYAGEPTKNILWDFSEAALERLTASEVRMIAQETERYTAGRAGGKTALVFSSTFAYGLGRMFELSRDGRSAPVDYGSFRDRASALAWIGGA